CMEGLEFPYTF
nr:immunoglobulin light chain junction region [Macaca mulatta]MOW55453.1 immunoglobulin light chain junction region [Macaca mulatta]